MRLLSPFLALGLLSAVLATPGPIDIKGRVEAPEAALDVPKARSPADGEAHAGDAIDSTNKQTDGGAETGTKFNGHNVPSMQELSGQTFKESIANGYWYGLSRKSGLGQL